MRRSSLRGAVAPAGQPSPAGPAGPTVRLAGVFCPDCRGRAGTVALEAGPVLLHHHARLDRSMGSDGPRSCTRDFVAQPDAASGRVAVTRVQGREEADRTLRSATSDWLARTPGRAAQFALGMMLGADAADEVAS